MYALQVQSILVNTFLLIKDIELCMKFSHIVSCICSCIWYRIGAFALWICTTVRITVEKDRVDHHSYRTLNNKKNKQTKINRQLTEIWECKHETPTYSTCSTKKWLKMFECDCVADNDFWWDIQHFHYELCEIRLTIPGLSRNSS